ncbi:MAG: outer membrane protein assembly factor BamD [Fluviicola sp.]
MKGLFFATLLLFLYSCSGYNSVLKGDDYKRKFELANELYDGKKFDRCIALYEQVYQRSSKTGEGELAYYRLGKASYEIEDWYLASYYLGSFQNKFPYSNKVEETVFLSAMCAVQNSPEPSLDQDETEFAIGDLQSFVLRFPNSELVDTCNAMMSKLRFKLETKDVLNIRLYSKTENYRAATVTSEEFLANYPKSQFREEMAVIRIQNSYKLTLNSVEDKKEARKIKTLSYIKDFIAEFPNSDYLREFGIYNKELEDLVIEKKVN